MMRVWPLCAALALIICAAPACADESPAATAAVTEAPQSGASAQLEATGQADASQTPAVTGQPNASQAPTVTAQLDASEAPEATAQPNALQAPLVTVQPEEYEVKTLIATARFASKPRIYTYNYLLGEYVCKLAEYDLVDDDSESMLMTLTFPEQLSQALAGFTDEERTFLLAMSMDALESMGFIVDAGEATELYGAPCIVFAAYTGDKTWAGWATMNDRQIQFVLATPDEVGQEFLSTVTARRTLEFLSDGYEVSYGGAVLRFPYSVDVQGGHALSENGLTMERAELLAIPDMAMLTGMDAEELLCKYLPEGASDVAAQALGKRQTLLYAHDDAELGVPVQGRLILLDDAVLRMEATFDNAGDVFMNDLYISEG
jgi:hypothetical protein